MPKLAVGPALGGLQPLSVDALVSWYTTSASLSVDWIRDQDQQVNPECVFDVGKMSSHQKATTIRTPRVGSGAVESAHLVFSPSVVKGAAASKPHHLLACLIPWLKYPVP